MTILPRPDQEVRIKEALRAGHSPEEIIDAGLANLPAHAASEKTAPVEEQSTAKHTASNSAERRIRDGRKSLPEVFEPIRGLLTDEEVDTLFARNRSLGRPVDLS